MSENRECYLVRREDEIAKLDAALGLARYWSRGLGWVPPELAPLLRARGPYLPDIWGEGE